MNRFGPVAVVSAAAACATALLAPVSGRAQAQTPANAGDASNDVARSARARQLARQFEANARVLTVFDRQGKVVTTVGDRAMYSEPIFSPDRTRLAVVKTDLESDTAELLVLDVATGASTRLTSNRSQERARAPVWSPDGTWVAYVALRAGYDGHRQNDLQTDDALVMAVDVSTTPTFQTGTPQLLFRLQGVLRSGWSHSLGVSRDGQRFVCNVNVPAGSTPAR